MSTVAGPEATATADSDQIKRTSGPQTTNGQRWEVQLSGSPSREWLDLFRTVEATSTTVVPRRLDFDRACAIFQSDEAHVKPWVDSIDKWLAWTNAKQRQRFEQVSRERSDRLEAGTKEKERIQELNDRFKDL